MADLVRSADYRDLLRIFNTNVDGKRKLEISLTKILGIGRRFGRVCLEKASIDPFKRGGEMTLKEEEELLKIFQDPVAHGIPVWMINKRKEVITGKDIHITSSQFSQQTRTELEGMRRNKCNRGLRHAAGIKVRGQRTKCTGRRAGVVGVQRKK
ncbi:Ribosomal protein S18 [Spironucleus salmonicida]|uniref:Ribosomal protein S18 n=1 Tax=Spironucleus salmonicida TaxID=348837 RepID=V6LNK0_9EUKA|nr:Ribosomal protein S18 [Spironucleus salmonicida]|eukprot:EST42314.1 Ribosomal protein S18 [Spironucleus salmonicida]